MEEVKENFHGTLSFKQYNRLKGLYLKLISLPFIFNLNRLALIYKTDKYGAHSYTKHYQNHFRKFKFKKIKLLEIGVGGHHYPNRGGCSLRMWKRYFPFGKIYALDIYDKSALQEPRIKIFRGSQADEKVLNEIAEQTGALDIIVDDGSHINEHVLKTFEVLFPKLKDGGIYVVEDTETSYWPYYGGNSNDLNAKETIMNYFKSLADGINYKEYLIKDYKPTYFDLNIVSIQFYHNLIFVFKGENNESSNIDWENMESVKPENPANL